jgi:hypothetical protein
MFQAHKNIKWHILNITGEQWAAADIPDVFSLKVHIF